MFINLVGVIFLLIFVFVSLIISCLSNWKKWYNKLSFNIILFLILIFLFSWLIYSELQPWEVEFETEHQIKELIFPDETKCQIFNCDEKIYNLTEVSNKWYPENDFIIIRKKWNPIYVWINYCDVEKLKKSNNQTFYLKNNKTLYLTELKIYEKEKI